MPFALYMVITLTEGLTYLFSLSSYYIFHWKQTVDSELNCPVISKMPPCPNCFSLMVGGRNKCIWYYHTFIYSIWCGYLNPIHNNQLPFLDFLKHQIFSSIESQVLVTDILCQRLGITCFKFCVILKYSIHVDKWFLWFYMFSIINECPHTLILSNTLAPIHSAYIF